MEGVLNNIHEELHIKSGKNFKKDNKEKVEETNLKINIPTDDTSVDKRISSPLKYFIISRGKNLRQSFIVGLNYWIKAPAAIEHLISEFIYLCHNFALIIDDIQDLTVLRRGQPCVHLVYGIPKALITAHYIEALAMNLILTMENPQLTQIVYESAVEMLRGQTMDIHWRDNSICPTESEYKTMIIRKTGELFFMIQHLSKTNIDVTPLIIGLSLYLLIADDYDNLWNLSYQESKGFCEDITEGKFSYPVLYVVRNFPEEGKLITDFTDILRQHTRDVKLLKYCRSLIEKCGGLEYTKKAVEKYKDIVIEESRKLGPNPVFDEEVVNKVLKRGQPIIV